MPPEEALDIGLWSGFTRRIMAVLLGAGLLVGGLLTAVSIWKQKAQWRTSLLLRGNTLARSLGRAAFVPLILEDSAALDGLAAGFAEESDVAFVALYSARGKILSQKPPLPELPLKEPPRELTAEPAVFPGRGAVRDFILPLRYGAGGAPGTEVSGYVRIGLTEERFRSEIRAVLRNNIALCLSVMAVAFLAGAILIQHMTRQMRGFIEQVQALSELKRSNKELEAFSYSVSHDLRTPLRAIDGFSHVLMEDYGDKLDEEAKGYLQRVRNGCERMGQLIDDLLSLSRVIRQEMRREAVDLAVLARSVAEQLAQADPGRRVAFTAPKNAPAVGDPGLLRIVLENLLGNAWKFTRKTESAKVEFGVKEEGGARVYFVRDNGAGFNMAYVGKLFGAFQRLHENAEFPGTGVGLATVQRIVHRHGGRIWAEGSVGGGATFYFTMKEES